MNKLNYILIAASIAVIIIGFLLMTGSSSTLEYNPDIYSFRRITIAPIVLIIGFTAMIFGIMYKPKK